MAEPVALTMGELDRLQVMTQLAERRLTRRRAAALLGLSARQVRRLYRAFRRDGAKAWRRGVVGARVIGGLPRATAARSEEHTSGLQSPCKLVCRPLLLKKKK